MPIANIVLGEASAARPEEAEGLIARWAQLAGIAADHMTINILPAQAQYGARFDVMAFLYLPTAWDAAQVAALQTGLAQAASEAFTAPPERVQVITAMIQSGQAVTGGTIETW